MDDLMPLGIYLMRSSRSDLLVSYKFYWFPFIVLLLVGCSSPARDDGAISIDKSEEYAQLIRNPCEHCHVAVHGLVARVLRGKTDSDFNTLSDDPKRKLIFLIGDDGLESFIGLTDREKLMKIGYTNDYVQRLKSEGYKFKLAIFSQESDSAAPSTWENTVDLAGKLYPTVAIKLKKQLPNLQKESFQEIQSQAPHKFADVDKRGPKSPDFIDLAKLEKSEGQLWQVRAFLYFESHLTDLYSGDGFTKLENGERGLHEYIGINRDLSSLGDVTVVDLIP